jgi:hypothetical protein
MGCVREAKSADRAAIVRMARAFHEASGLPLPFDPVYAAMVTQAYIADSNKLCLVLDEGGPAGVLAASVYRHPLAPVLAADELIWWIEPEHRGRAALEMLSTYEAWARSKGCAVIGMATPPGDERAAVIYRRRGFAAAGSHFIKSI